MQKKLPKVFLDININHEPAGRLTIELFEDKVPKTTENFKQLVLKQKYKNTSFDRIVPGFSVFGGNIEKEGAESIYGKRFADESFEISHDTHGLVSMQNQGPDTNGSAFFITLQKCEWLDQKNVVFGRVVEGLDTLAKVEEAGDAEGKPTKQVSIADCGEVAQ